MENELLQQVLEQLNSLQADVKNMQDSIQALELKVDTGFSNIDRKFSELTKDISRTVSEDVTHVVSTQLNDIRTEVSIIKSAVGEHELDLKYFKKVTIPNFKSPTV